jgi:hypothetical protein
MGLSSVTAGSAKLAKAKEFRWLCGALTNPEIGRMALIF